MWLLDTHCFVYKMIRFMGKIFVYFYSEFIEMNTCTYKTKALYTESCNLFVVTVELFMIGFLPLIGIHDVPN